jgi:hypothetical protein
MGTPFPYHFVLDFIDCQAAYREQKIGNVATDDPNITMKILSCNNWLLTGLSS